MPSDDANIVLQDGLDKPIILSFWLEDQTGSRAGECP